MRRKQHRAATQNFKSDCFYYIKITYRNYWFNHILLEITITVFFFWQSNRQQSLQLNGNREMKAIRISKSRRLFKLFLKIVLSLRFGILLHRSSFGQKHIFLKSNWLSKCRKPIRFPETVVLRETLRWNSWWKWS